MKQVGRVVRRISVLGHPDRVADDPVDEEELDMPKKDWLAALAAPDAARVTASMDIKDNDHGQGFGAFVSVTLACHQNEDSIREAHGSASALVREFVVDTHKMALEAYKATRS